MEISRNTIRNAYNVNQSVSPPYKKILDRGDQTEWLASWYPQPTSRILANVSQHPEDQDIDYRTLANPWSYLVFLWGGGGQDNNYIPFHQTKANLHISVNRSPNYLACNFPLFTNYFLFVKDISEGHAFFCSWKCLFPSDIPLNLCITVE